jgi:hypothetical protein
MIQCRYIAAERISKPTDSQNVLPTLLYERVGNVTSFLVSDCILT